MSFNLRKKTRLSYNEFEEPSFDEYLYCERCSDFVYDYCAIHGPLLVIPDNKVPVKTGFPPSVPHAALTVPHVFLHLAPSLIPGAGLGVFSTLTLPRGVRFGPYTGRRTQDVDSMYCWQIYDKNNKRSHVVDAADVEQSNWMRYVNCSRHWKEQNLLAYQYKGQLYYRTIKIIPRYTELMVFYGREFANALHIDLSKYNSPKYYREIISTSTKTLHENNDTLQDYLTADHFQIIDEDFVVNDNNKNSTESIKTTDEILCKKIDESLHKVIKKQNSDSNKNTVKIRYPCDLCQKSFASSKSLKEHKLGHLDIWKYHCEFCLFKSNKLYRFNQHVGKHRNTFQFSCEKCSFGTNYKRTFKNHCLRHESIQKVSKTNSLRSKVYFSKEKTCEICDFKTISRKVYFTHMSKHKGNVYKCDLCSYSNHSKYNLSRHINRSGKH